MAYVLIHHQVARYSDFEAVYLQDAARRRRLGCKGAKVFRDSKESNDVFIVLEWSGMAGAHEFAEGYETQEAMKWATSGAGKPLVWVVEDVLETDA